MHSIRIKTYCKIKKTKPKLKESSELNILFKNIQYIQGKKPNNIVLEEFQTDILNHAERAGLTLTLVNVSITLPNTYNIESDFCIKVFKGGRAMVSANNDRPPECLICDLPCTIISEKKKKKILENIQRDCHC